LTKLQTKVSWIPFMAHGVLRTAAFNNLSIGQGGYYCVVVCLSLCLSVSNFAQKLLNWFAWNF